MKRLTFILICCCILTCLPAMGQKTQTKADSALQESVEKLEKTQEKMSRQMDSLRRDNYDLERRESFRDEAAQAAQKTFDLAMTFFTIMVAFFGIIITFISARGLGDTRKKLAGVDEDFTKIRKRIETDSQDVLKKVSDKEQELVVHIKTFEERLEKADSEILRVTKARQGVEQEIDELRSKIPDTSLIDKPLPEVQKQLDELTKKLREFESLGGELEAEEHLRKGIDLYQKKLHDLSLLSFERAIEIKPDYAEAWFFRGVVLGELKRLDEALQSYDEAAKHREFMQIFFNRAAIYAQKGNKVRALENLEKSIKLRDANRIRAKNTEDFKEYLGDKDFIKLVGE